MMRQAPAPAAAAAPLNGDTPIETLIASPVAKPLVLKHFPDLDQHPAYEQFKSLSLRALAPHGRLIVFGVDNTQGKSRLTSEQIVQLIFKNQAYVGFSSFTLPSEQKAKALSEVLGYVSKGQLEVVVGQTFPLDEASAAHRALASRTTTGKVVLVPGDHVRRAR